MNCIELDRKSILSEKDFHEEIAKQFNILPYYGKNLDSLWDLLSCSIERPVCIIWHDSEDSKNSMGLSFYKIIHVLQMVKQQDDNFGFTDKFNYIL